MDGRFFISGAITPLPPWRADEDAAFTVELPAADPAQPLHDPPLAARDETVFLLTAAAEIEHALLAQYLYSAYSVQIDDEDDADPRRPVRDVLLQIAREEMGHLVTVQNLLHAVGGPPHLGRDPAPAASGDLPVRLHAGAAVAPGAGQVRHRGEPEPAARSMTPEEKVLLTSIRADAVRANGGQEISHVGRIFDRLECLFTHGA